MVGSTTATAPIEEANESTAVSQVSNGDISNDLPPISSNLLRKVHSHSGDSDDGAESDSSSSSELNDGELPNLMMQLSNRGNRPPRTTWTASSADSSAAKGLPGGGWNIGSSPPQTPGSITATPTTRTAGNRPSGLGLVSYHTDTQRDAHRFRKMPRHQAT